MSSLQKKIIAIRSGEHVVSPHLVSLQATPMHTVAGVSPASQKISAAPIISHNFQVNLQEEAGLSEGKLPSKAQLPEGIVPSKAQLPQELSLPAIGAIDETLISTATSSQKIVGEEAELLNQQFFGKTATKLKQGLHQVAPSKKAAVAFVLVALLIVTPLKAITTFEQLNAAKSSLTDLRQLPSLPLANADQQIRLALSSFHAANNDLQKINPVEEFILQHVPVFGDQYGAASRLTAAGEHVSLAAAAYWQLFQTLKEKKGASLDERLQLFFAGHRAVARDLNLAAELVRPIDTSKLPTEQQDFVATAKKAIIALDQDAAYLNSAGPIILSALGTTAPRRYLLVFQNPAELRPTGGFIGSFAILDMENGAIKKLEVPAGGSYDLQGALKLHLRAPLPLHVINPRWEFQDGNWFPDFPTSAQKLMWFLEKSQGPSVDGVIAINSTVLPELLAIAGPIKTAGLELNADNALQTLRENIDTAAVKNSNKPKEAVATATDALFSSLQNSKPEDFLPLVSTLLKNLEQREIQIYARDTSTQKQLADFGWDGTIRDNPRGDYLDVVTTNIGGQKTDSLITQQINHQAEIADDGTVTVTVQIQRQQKTSAAAYEDTPNVSFIRVYVPAGSELIDARGFIFPPESMFHTPEIWDKPDGDLQKTERELGIDQASGTRITAEFSHTVFGNWLITKPGDSVIGEFKYRLPFKVTPVPRGVWQERLDSILDNPATISYSLLVQRQSGLPTTTLTARVLLPTGWRLSWVSSPQAIVAENGLLLEVPFLTDLFYGVTASQNH